MKLRFITALFAFVLIAACGGGATEPVEEAAPVEAEPAMDDAAAIEALTTDWVAHYNMHHAGVVAGYHTEGTVSLPANGGVYMGVEAVTASLEEEMAASPTLAVHPADTIISGDWAVTRGHYVVDNAPEGAEPFRFSGNFMTVFQKADDEWKVAYLIGNYEDDPPAAVPFAPNPEEPGEEVMDGMLADLNDYYATHFNMGHGQMVADNVYAENAVAMIANRPAAEGRAAIGEMLQARVDEASPQLTIHTIGEEDIGGGYVIGGGWYESASDAGNVVGNFMTLAQQTDDGGYEIVWVVTNAKPAE